MCARNGFAAGSSLSLHTDPLLHHHNPPPPHPPHPALVPERRLAPWQVLQALLNLAEFMEHESEALPVDIRVLADLALNCHAHAKALHYKEYVFRTSPESVVADLIGINTKLDQPEAAAGILIYAQKHHLLGEEVRGLRPAPVWEHATPFRQHAQ